MLIYILFLVFLFCLYTVKDRTTFKNFDEQSVATRNLKVALGGFVFLCLLFGLRHPSMGNDLHYLDPFGYLGSFDRISSYSWLQVLSIKKFQNYQRGYIIFNKIIGTICNKRQFFMFSVAFLSLLPIYLFIRKQSKSPFLSWIVFFGLPIFLMYYSGYRQILAIAVCVLSIEFIQSKKIWFFLLLIVLATLFHYTAWVFIIAYPLYYYRPTRNIRWGSIITLFVVYLFRIPIFEFLSAFIKNDVSISENGAITLFLVFVAIYVICFLFMGKLNLEERERIEGFLNIFYVTCLIQSMAGLHNLVLRIGYYFMVVLIVLLPNVIKSTSLENNRKILSYGVIACFYLYGLYSLKHTFWANAVPYYFFWQSV